MLGTIINTVAILLGCIFGLILKDKFKDNYSLILSQSVGIAVIFIGISNCLSRMILPEANPILFIVSLVIGSLIGEFINIEGKLEKLGMKLQSRFGSSESSISKAFVSASLLFCVGSMAILGPLESSIQGVHTILFAKSILDGISSIIFASTMGIGVMFSAAAVFIYQGSITMLARFIQPYLTDEMIREITIIGGILITGLGIDLLGLKKMKIANMLPSLIVPVFYYVIYDIIYRGLENQRYS